MFLYSVVFKDPYWNRIHYSTKSVLRLDISVYIFFITEDVESILVFTFAYIY